MKERRERVQGVSTMREPIAGDPGAGTSGADVCHVVRGDCRDVEVAWRSLAMSFIASAVTVAYCIAWGPVLDLEYAALHAGAYAILFALAWGVCQTFRRLLVRGPRPSCFGESRALLLVVGGMVLMMGPEEVAGLGLYATTISLFAGAFVDAFWLAEVGARRGVGLRRAAVLALSAQPLRFGRLRQPEGRER